jgi:bacillolysin/thermolysin
VVAPAAGTPRPVDESCFLPGTTQESACPLTNDMTLNGYIQASGQTNTYRFEVGSTNMHVTADLTSLPADYDLYLVDINGSVLSQSIQEGLSSEEVDTVLDPGTYYLFVHSDPGRVFDANNPYTIHLTLAPSAPPAAGLAP